MANGQFFTSSGQAEEAGINVTQPSGFDESQKTIFNPLGSSLNQAAQAAGLDSYTAGLEQGYNFVDTHQPGVIKTDQAKDDIQTDVENLQGLQNEEAPVKEEKDTSAQDALDALNDGELTPEQEELQGINEQISTEIDTQSNLIDQARTGLSQDLQNQLSGIQESYGRRKRQMEIFNKNQIKGKALRGARTGRQRFAADLQMDIMSAEESAGVQRISDIDSAMRQEMNAAESAFRQNDLSLLREKSLSIQSLLEQKRQAVLDQANLSNQQEQRLMDRIKFNQEQQVFEQGQAEYTAEIEAINKVEIDENGNITSPTDEEINSIAEMEGIDPDILRATIKSRIAELEKAQVEARDDELDRIKKEISIEQAELNLQQDKARGIGGGGGGGNTPEDTTIASDIFTPTTGEQRELDRMSSALGFNLNQFSGKFMNTVFSFLTPAVREDFFRDLIKEINSGQSSPDPSQFLIDFIEKKEGKDEEAESLADFEKRLEVLATGITK